MGSYNGLPMFSYNEAYGYQLPLGGYQLYNPYDPYQNPGRGGYYPRESFYSWAPYGRELYNGPRLRDRFHAGPADAPVVLPPLAPVPANAEQTVTVEVNVPAGAEVWFDGEKTSQSGPGRVFRSPPLQAGVSYMYLVRAKWTEAGREVEQMQTISVHAGERINVAFPLARP
jgi:uncharacterized protein (TIGR03000 family)